MYICWEKRVEPYNNHKPMKKITAILALAAACLFAAQTASAIEDPNPKGTIVAGAHAGFVYTGIYAYGDYCLVDSWWKGHFTVGPMAGFSTLGYGYGRYTYLDLAARATYGLNITNNFEVHLGTVAGFSLIGDRYDNGSGIHSDHSVHAVFGGLAGLRYFFTESLAISTELVGAGHFPTFNVGVAFKF